MTINEDVTYWRGILEQYRGNLRKLRQQQAVFARGEEPLNLLNQIEASMKTIREAISKLRELGIEPQPSTIDPPDDRTSYQSSREEQTKAAPSGKVPPVPDNNEDSKDKIEKNTPLIFISYAREDEAKARDLYNRLTQLDFRPWLDKEDILPGEEWNLKINHTLRQSDFLLICLSKKSITKRGYIQKEIRMAVDIAKEMPEGTIFLIPVRLEDCEVPASLEKYQWVDLFSANGFNKLVKAIHTEWKKRH